MQVNRHDEQSRAYASLAHSLSKLLRVHLSAAGRLARERLLLQLAVSASRSLVRERLCSSSP